MVENLNRNIANTYKHSLILVIYFLRVSLLTCVVGEVGEGGGSCAFMVI